MVAALVKNTYGTLDESWIRSRQENGGQGDEGRKILGRKIGGVIAQKLRTDELQIENPIVWQSLKETYS